MMLYANPEPAIALAVIAVAGLILLRARLRQIRQAEDKVRFDPSRYS